MRSLGAFLSLQRKVCLAPLELIEPSHLYYLAMDVLQTVLDIFHPDELDSDYSDQGTPQHFPQVSLPQFQGRTPPGTAMGHIYTMLRSDTEGATEFRNLPSLVPSGSSLTIQGGDTTLGFAQAYVFRPNTFYNTRNTKGTLQA